MSTARQIHEKTAIEERNASVSFKGKMEEGESIIGVPTVTDATGELIIASISISTEILKVNGVLVPVGQVVQYTEKAGVAECFYLIKITASTDKGQILKGTVRLRVVPD